MRRLIFIVIMIALLPLRGWVGDAMATQMALHGSGQTSVATDGHHGDEVAGPSAHGPASSQVGQPHHTDDMQATGMLPDCAQHGAEPTGDHAESGCANCAFCQVCHTVALAEIGPSMSPSFSAAPALRTSAVQFASAEAALGQKPPIS